MCIRDRDDSDAILTAICGRPCRDHRSIDQVTAEAITKPGEMSYVIVVDTARQLYLERNDSVLAFDDEVDLVITVPSAEVRDMCPGRLRGRAYRQRGKRLEQVAQQRAIIGNCDAPMTASKKVRPVALQQPHGERGISDVVLRRCGETGEVVAARDPCFERVEDAQLGQQICVVAGGRLCRLVLQSSGRRFAQPFP